jgi:transforming growth factor-beta-induced protein
VPNDVAFRKITTWNSADAAVATPMLQYHIINSGVSIAAMKEGDSTFLPTLLTDPAKTNVSGGQRVILTKQPGNSNVLTSGVAARATIVQPDIPFKGGFIQVIDALLVAPAGVEKTARDAYTDLTSFVGALYATDLIKEVVESKDLTIFAPRNAAFQQLSGTISGQSKEALTKILRYHLVPGKVVRSEDLINGTVLSSSLPSESLRIIRFNNNIYINSAQFIQTDILIANGVVQMIDNILNPDNDGANPDTALDTQVPVFPITGATATGTAAPTPFVSNLPCTTNCPVKTGSNSTGVSSSTSRDGVAPARCTGLAGLGMGIGVAMGVMGMDYIGIV